VFFPLNPAAGTNLLSVLFAALTTFLLFIYLERKIDKASAIFATLIFSVSPVFFSQAIRTEVYTIMTFFFILELYLIEEKRYLILSYISGLSILVHPLLWLLFPYIFFLIVKNCKKGIFFIFLGFSISLYLPIRAKLHPLINWGDPETIPKFFYHLLRLEYYKDAPEYSLSLLFSEYKLWFKCLFITSNFGLLISIYGMFFIKENIRRHFILLFIYSIFLTFLIHSPTTPDRLYIVKIFYIPQLILLIIFLGYGLANIKVKYRWVLFLFLILGNIFFAADEGIFWRNWTAEDFKNAVLSQVAKGDVIISKGDALTFPLAYGGILTKKVEVYDVAGDLRPLPPSIVSQKGYVWSITPLESVKSFHIPFGLLWYNGLKSVNTTEFDWNNVNIRYGGQENPLDKEIYVHFLLMKARALFCGDKIKGGFLYVKKAENCSKNNPYLLNHIGTLLAEYEFYKKAKPILLRALQNGFKTPDIYHNIVLIDIYDGNFREAYKYVKDGLESNDAPTLYNDMGIIFIKTGRTNNARTMFLNRQKKD